LSEFENVDVCYKELVEDNDAITVDDPDRGTLVEQIRFVEEIPEKGRYFKRIRMLVAIIK
jgi:hypothetical protein